MKREIRPSTKPISARVNRAAWDWLEMQGVNKNKLLNDLLESFTKILQHNDEALKEYLEGTYPIELLYVYYLPQK